MNTRPKILQQYYTRAREGIFRSNEGLDTVAKSPRLENQFIKKTLHPFCVYTAPRELTERGESDRTQFPDSLTVFPAESGELVIGRGIFAGADFTGQRDTIFVHHYVIPLELREKFLQCPEKILWINSFKSYYDNADGKELPEYDDLDYEKGSHDRDPLRILNDLEIDNTLFMQLLFAIMASISSHKKVYIALNQDISESSRHARRLLGVIYRCLPYEMRRGFGFTTFIHEPQGKKYMNVMFVEKGSIRGNDRFIEKDFVFDFPHKRFSNIDTHIQPSNYLEFVWNNLQHFDELEAFYHFAEEALQEIDAKLGLAISTYDQLVSLFWIERGRWNAYEADKEGIMNSVIRYLKVKEPENKTRLLRLFDRILSRESDFIGKGESLLGLEYVHNLLEYYRIMGKASEVLHRIGNIFIQSLTNARKRMNQDDMFHAIQSIQKEPELFQMLVGRMLKEYPDGIIDYVNLQFGKLKSIQGLKDELEFWTVNYPDLFNCTFFKDQCLYKMNQLLGRGREQITNGREMVAFIQQKSESERGARDIYVDLGSEIRRWMLTELTLNDLTLEDLEKLDDLIHRSFGSLPGSLGRNEQDKLKVLQTVWNLLKEQQRDPSDLFGHLNHHVIEDVRNFTRKLLKDKLTRHTYEPIALTFYTGYDFQGMVFDYSAMLRFVSAETKGTDTIYDFMNWTASKSWFLERGQLKGSYIRAIYGYFNKLDRGALRNRKVWKKAKQTDSLSLRKMYKNIKLEQSNFIVKFLVRYARKFFRRHGRAYL